LRAAEKKLELTVRGGFPSPRDAGGRSHTTQPGCELTWSATALKFTERGEIVVKADLKSRDDDSVLLHITVRDTGIGIPAEKQAAIFEAFSQADSPPRANTAAPAWGLTISLRLVKMMGGRNVGGEPARPVAVVSTSRCAWACQSWRGSSQRHVFAARAGRRAVPGCGRQRDQPPHSAR
jgi:hypothetical protein